MKKPKSWVLRGVDDPPKEVPPGMGVMYLDSLGNRLPDPDPPRDRSKVDRTKSKAARQARKKARRKRG